MMQAATDISDNIEHGVIFHIIIEHAVKQYRDYECICEY